MQYLEAILMMLGGIGALLIGMAMLSDNMRKIANTKLEGLFNKTNKSKLMGFGIGVGSTAVVQSSSITTVMVIGLVNAGVLSLLQATTIIMGANVGTTITAQIASLQAFDFIIFAMVLAFIGAFMTVLCKTEKIKTVGKVFSGLGIIFIALHLLGNSMDAFKESPEIVKMLSSLSNPFLLLLIGIVVTALFQSSSAIAAIVISMSIAGIAIGNGGNDPLFVILGTNIGTTITALISAIGANTNAKRASVIHVLFNVLGSLIFIIFLLLWPGFKQEILATLFKQEATQIAMFHTFFNIVCALLFLPFAGVFVNISRKIIQDKEKKYRQTVVLDERLLQTPALAIHQLKKETVIMAQNAMDCLRSGFHAFIEKDVTVKENVQSMIKNTNRINKQITTYLVKLSGETLNYEEKIEVSALYHIVNDLERIGDLADNLIKYTEVYVYEKLNFTDVAMDQIKEMFAVIEELFAVTIEVFEAPTIAKLEMVDALEQQVDDFRKTIVDDHIIRLEEGVCSPDSSPILINLVSNLERAADHMNFIAHAKH